MEHFHHGHHVRLRSRARGEYLHADEDGRGVSLQRARASIHAAWAVHLHQFNNDPHLLLHSAAYGGYLGSTGAQAPRGHRGLRVEQLNYDHPDEEDIVWQAVVLEPGGPVFLNHFRGGCLRANGRYRRWNNGVSVELIGDIDNISTMMHWIVEQIPTRETIPRLPRPSFLPIPDAMLSSRGIMFVWTNMHGELITNGFFGFLGRSVFHLREELALRLGNLAMLDASDVVVCFPSRDGRAFPLVVDLPRSVQTFHIVIVITGTPAHAALRYADVNA